MAGATAARRARARAERCRSMVSSGLWWRVN
jgi:hypothetical protein